MRRLLSILALAVILLSFTQNADAYGRGGYYRGGCYRGGYHYGYGYRPVYPAVPAPYYRPYYAPVPACRWIAPHYRRTPYGDVFVPGHYAR